MSVDVRSFLTAFACGASVPAVALFVAVSASADPAAPAVPPGPNPAPAVVAAAPAPGPLAPPDGDGATPPVPDQLPTPPNGISHLASPDAPPPGSTMNPEEADRDSPNVSYLKDLWQAVQNHDISGKQALLMGVAQRGMNTPYPDQAPGPNVPTSPVDPAAAPPPPALPDAPPVPPAPAVPLPASP
ncbi:MULTISPECIES: hypothetical protein [unclassified Mycobacterium]|uniref:hypothetical protein n=1 Tax=unclassified Mycobacterium TaxID=2642494 RepID=UPI0029C67B0F|nr:MULTISPECIES: hypothetical protein [unclassified Mycobacterium]